MKITVLGSGSSAGVPALRYGWGECNKNNPKNFRTRSSIIIESGSTSLLVDMSPDIRQQLFDYGSEKIDAVICTHAHFDHINGINELKPLFDENNKSLHVYGTQSTIDLIKRVFFYLFKNDEHHIDNPYIFPHIVDDKFTIGDISGICFEHDHSFLKSLGIRIGNFAYSTDVAYINDEIFEKLEGIDTWIVDCTSLKIARPSHANLDLVLEWIKRINPKRTFLTHMGVTMDYDTLIKILPESIKPAYDQMTIVVD